MAFQPKYDIPYSLELELPHLSWAKPAAAGPLKALMAPSVRNGREVVELCHRFDIELTALTLDREWDLNKWGLGEFYGINRAGVWDFKLPFENLEKAVTDDKEYDVMVIPGLNGWAMYTPETQAAILRRVENGCGLVIVKPMHGRDYENQDLHSDALEAISPLKPLFNEGYKSDRFAGDGFPDVAYDAMKRGRWVAGDHPITRGIPLELLPFEHMAYYPYEATGGEVIVKAENGDPIISVSQYGRGRVVALGYYPRTILPQHADFTGRENFYESIVDNIAGGTMPTTYNFTEYAYALVYRCMAWAAGRLDAAVTATLDGLKLAVQADGADEVKAFVINDWDETVFETTQPAGQTIELPAKLQQLGGEFRIELRSLVGGKVAAFASMPVSWPRIGEIVELKLDADAYRHGDTVAISANTAGTAGDLTIYLQDDFGRQLARFEAPGHTGTAAFSYKIEDWPSLHIYAVGELAINGQVVSRVRSANGIVNAGSNRKVNDYEVFMNAQNRGWGDFWAAQRKVSQSLGVTAAYPGSTKMLTETGVEGLGIYWYHRFPYVARKEQYVTTRDKKYLTRVPCLNDETFWAKNDAAVSETVGKNQKFGAVSYYANDEGSLTCYTDQLELCHCPHCRGKMREWLQEKYGTLEALNHAWGRSYTEWAQVEPDSYDEAYERNHFGSWGDHRLFMEHTFAGSYERIIKNVRAVDPQGVIRMSGCQASTVYSGYDYYMLHRHIGYFEAYGGGNQMELHRSFKEPDTMIGGWMGYGARGLSAQYAIWYAILHGLTMNSVFCEYSMINPDFTCFQGALDMAATFNEVRRGGLAKLLLYGTKRDSLGIAIHYSMPSIHAAYIDDSGVQYDQNRQAWVDVLEDLGYQYDFIATQQIDMGNLSQYRVLILPYIKAMSQQTADAIRTFVENGGVVFADCQTAIMDDNCRMLEAGRLDDVFGIKRYSMEARNFYVSTADFATSDFPYFTVTAKEDQGLQIAEPETRLAGGKAALVQDFSRIIPALIVNEYGKGKAVYLNSFMTGYTRTKNDADCPTRDFVEAVLQMAGVCRPAALSDNAGQPVIGNVERVFYNAGDAQYFAALRGITGRIAYDGRLESDGAQSATADTYTVKFARPGHLYNMRTGDYYGYTDTAAAAMASGEAMLIANLPAAVQGVTITGPAAAKAGDDITFSFGLQADSDIGPAVFAFNLYDANGDYVLYDSQNLLADGCAAQKTFKLPYNAARGQWRATVRCAATGHTAEMMVDVQ